MTNEKYEKEFKDLKFGIQLAVRYHQHRRSFYDFWLRFITFLIIFSGSSAAASIAQSNSALGFWFTVLVTFLSTLMLVFRLNESGRVHFYLGKQFIELEKKIVGHEGNATKEGLIALTQERLAIESEEPPVMSIVYDLCYNEMLQKKGGEEANMLKFKFYHFLTKHIANWGFSDVAGKDRLTLKLI